MDVLFVSGKSDGSLSDTAVGQQQWNETSSVKNESRSPKSEISSREMRDPMGSGMGRKSNSTSQLSATGLFVHSSHSSFHFEFDCFDLYFHFFQLILVFVYILTQLNGCVKLKICRTFFCCSRNVFVFVFFFLIFWLPKSFLVFVILR